jgi:hypothetical protein
METLEGGNGGGASSEAPLEDVGSIDCSPADATASSDSMASAVRGAAGLGDLAGSLDDGGVSWPHALSPSAGGWGDAVAARGEAVPLAYLCGASLPNCAPSLVCGDCG